MKLLLVALVVVVLFLQYRFWFADGGLIQVFHFKKEIKEQQEKNNDIKKHNATLSSEIDSLKKGGEAIENRARSDLGMVKKGETFYQVTRTSKASESHPGEDREF